LKVQFLTRSWHGGPFATGVGHEQKVKKKGTEAHKQHFTFPGGKAAELPLSYLLFIY